MTACISQLKATEFMTGPTGNSEFCFPLNSMFHSALPQETLRVSGKQNSPFPLEPVNVQRQTNLLNMV